MYPADSGQSPIHGIEDDGLCARALNGMGHETHSVHQALEWVEDNKPLFKRILDAFLDRYRFVLSALSPSTMKPTEAPAT
jgi:hypothetical protein